ncbi:MAG: cation-binding protein [Candidatus Aminicenantes bacterium]|nr:cation-binding protein [Candidatus Aminicenantes bacterium]
MKPRGPLMIEHRLIEKMISLIENEISKIADTGKTYPDFIDTAVDFIRTYADRTHHGKEEDILFRECKKKTMSPQDTQVMNELIDEHKFGRKVVGELVKARQEYVKEGRSLETIADKLQTLVDFYPKHIKKEDDVFFPHSEKYFSADEQQLLLQEFWEFDKNMIHEKYKAVVEQLKNK